MPGAERPCRADLGSEKNSGGKTPVEILIEREWKKKTRRGNKNKNELKQLTIFYQNVRGLKSKLPSLQIIAAEYCPSIICIVETHLSENDPDFAQWSEDVEGDQSLFQIEGYNVIRNDRNGSGGGCLIAYKKELRTLITEVDADAEKHENLWLTVGIDVAKIKLGVIYMPGENTRKKELQDAYKEIESELHNRKPNE